MTEQRPPQPVSNNGVHEYAEVTRLEHVQKVLNRLLPLTWLSAFTFVVGVVAMLLYVLTLDAKSRWGVFGLLIVFGAAAVAVGALFGFIFEVPRVVSQAHAAGMLANTNLEQISDWLTKVLVGATLTQLGHIPSAADSLFTGMAHAMGPGSSGKGFAGALVIYGVTAGFLACYMATRTSVGWALILGSHYEGSNDEGGPAGSPQDSRPRSR
jgi:hypothetical protein